MMKNVCFFNTTVFWGGGEKLILEYTLEFIQRNYKVYLAASKGSPLYKKAEQQNIRLFDTQCSNLSFLNILKQLSLYRFFKNERIDTVIFTTSPDLKSAGFSAKCAGVKKIVYLRGLAVPIRNTLINRILFRDILTHIIANSLETKRTILRNLGTAITIDDKVRVIYHGIDLELFDKKSGDLSIQRSNDEILIGNAGRLTIQKGQADLIKIAKRLKDNGLKFKILIAGTGELKPDIERLIERFNLENEVLLLGFVEDMARFMHCIDIFVLSSSWEGFGYVLVEAMAACKPVVAYNVSSNSEVVGDHQTGFLVDYPDLDMFCRNIELLAADEILRSQLGKNGRQVVENHFQLKDRMNELEEYLLNG